MSESTGPAVDRHGDDIIDPTKNVEKLVEAAIERQDDLREGDKAHVRELIKLRAEYDRELREAETKRIDAIRQVDVQAGIRSAEVQTTREATLAASVAESAAAMRVQVEAAAKAAAESLGKALEPIQKDIQDLRRVQYEGVGQKGQVAESRAGSANTGLWLGLGFTAFLVLIALIGLAVTIAVSAHP